MKKTLSALLAACLLVGGLSYWWLTSRPGPAALLSATRTAGVVFTGPLDGLAARLDVGAGGLPATLRAALPRFLDSGRRGFDAADASAWAELGLAADRGVALVADAGLVTPSKRPAGGLLLPLTDRGRFETWLRQLGFVVDGDAVRLGERAWKLTSMGTYTVVTPEAVAVAGFVDEPDTPLTAHPAFPDVGEAGLGFLNGQGMGALMAALGSSPGSVAALDYYARLFPALSWQGGALKLACASEGCALLQESFLSQAPPSFSRYLPPSGHVTLRLALRLGGALDKAVKFVPSTAVVARRNISTLALVAPMFLGVGVPDLEEVATGQIALSGSVEDLMAFGRGGDALALFEVREIPKTDEVVSILMGKLAKGQGVEVRRVPVAGREALFVKSAQGAVACVRDERVLLVATGPEVLAAALSREASLSKKAAKLLDSDAALVLIADPKAFAPLAAPLGSDVVDFLKNLSPEPVVLTARILTDGLVFALESGAGALEAATFALAAGAWRVSGM